MSGHSFPVDARCECGVAMSYLIRAGHEVARCAAQVLRASIEDPESRLDLPLSDLNLALLKYSAGIHRDGATAIILGELDPEEKETP